MASVAVMMADLKQSEDKPKLENVALSLRSLIVQDRTVKASAPSPCSCESDNNEQIQPIGRGGLSY